MDYPGCRPRDPLGASVWADESDVAVALLRTALVVALFLSPLQQSIPVGLPAVVLFVIRLAPVISAVVSIGVFASYLWAIPLRGRRPVAIITDLFLIGAATAAIPEPVAQRQWVAALYYLLIMVGAIWFRRTGAIVTAVLASILDGVFRLDPYLQVHGVKFIWLLLAEGQTVAMLTMAIATSYVVISRDREFRRANQLVFDVQMARALQDRMLPDALPQMPGFDIGLAFSPARVVGGDLYDLVPTGPDSFLLCVGDMPGKSVYGLVHLSMIHSHMRAGVRQGVPPDQIAQLINRNAYDALQPDSYAALFIAQVTVSTRALEFVNCGHLPPLLITPGRSDVPRELSSGGIVIGATRTPDFSPRFVTMQTGDILVLYTDGITEARDRSGEEFGGERLVHAALGHQAEDAPHLAQSVMRASEGFSVDPAADDRTVLVIRAVG